MKKWIARLSVIVAWKTGPEYFAVCRIAKEMSDSIDELILHGDGTGKPGGPFDPIG